MNLQIYDVKIDMIISSKQTMKQHLKSYLRRGKTKVFFATIKKSRDQARVDKATRYTKERLEEAKGNLDSIY